MVHYIDNLWMICRIIYYHTSFIGYCWDLARTNEVYFSLVTFLCVMDLDCVLAPIQQFLIAGSIDCLGVCKGWLFKQLPEHWHKALLEVSKLLAGSTLGAVCLELKLNWNRTSTFIAYSNVSSKHLSSAMCSPTQSNSSSLLFLIRNPVNTSRF